MAWITPVIDRNTSDVSDVKNGINNSKGAFNVVDANRIESNCEYLRDFLNSNGYYVNISVKKDWKRSDWFNEKEITRVRDNIRALKNAFYTSSNVPQTLSDTMTPNYSDINAMEQILNEINKLINLTLEQALYCNDVYCGE